MLVAQHGTVNWQILVTKLNHLLAQELSTEVDMAMADVLQH